MRPAWALGGRAWVRLVNIANQAALSPVDEADRATSKADARTALCLAAGVATADIDPASGADLSAVAYQRSRKSWLRELTAAPLTQFVVRGCRQTGEYWRRHRPDLVAQQPWPRLRACESCDMPETQWDSGDPLHLPESGKCLWCRRADIEDDERAKGREGR